MNLLGCGRAYRNPTLTNFQSIQKETFKTIIIYSFFEENYFLTKLSYIGYSFPIVEQKLLYFGKICPLYLKFEFYSMKS